MPVVTNESSPRSPRGCGRPSPPRPAGRRQSHRGRPRTPGRCRARTSLHRPAPAAAARADGRGRTPAGIGRRPSPVSRSTSTKFEAGTPPAPALIILTARTPRWPLQRAQHAHRVQASFAAARARELQRLRHELHRPASAKYSASPMHSIADLVSSRALMPAASPSPRARAGARGPEAEVYLPAHEARRAHACQSAASRRGAWLQLPSPALKNLKGRAGIRSSARMTSMTSSVGGPDGR